MGKLKIAEELIEGAEKKGTGEVAKIARVTASGTEKKILETGTQDIEKIERMRDAESAFSPSNPDLLESDAGNIYSREAGAKTNEEYSNKFNARKPKSDEEKIQSVFASAKNNIENPQLLLGSGDPDSVNGHSYVDTEAVDLESRERRNRVLQNERHTRSNSTTESATNAEKIEDITSNKKKSGKINNKSDYAANVDAKKVADILGTKDEDSIRSKLKKFGYSGEQKEGEPEDTSKIDDYINASAEDRKDLLNKHLESRKGRDLNFAEKAGYYKAPQKLGTAGVGLWMVSSMSKNKGQQSNAQLYGQQQPYQ